MKQEVKRFWSFLLCSAAVLAFLFFLFPPILFRIGGYANETVMPTDVQSRRALLALLPALIAYCFSIGAYLVPAPRRLQRLTFPLATFVLCCLAGSGGVAWAGQAFGWILIFALPLGLVFIVIMFLWGWRLDRRHT